MQIHLKADVCLLHGLYNPQKGHGSTHFPCGGHRAVQHGILGTSWAHSGWVLGVKILGEEEDPPPEGSDEEQDVDDLLDAEELTGMAAHAPQGTT